MKRIAIPVVRARSITAGDLSASCVAETSLATTSGGVPAGAKSAHPRLELEIGIARLDRRGHVGQQRMARLRGHRERAHAPRLHEAEQRRRRGDRHLHRASDDVLHHRPRALVGHVHDVDAGLLLEELHADVRHRAAAGRA
jgi:hypothetical protein